MQHDLQVCPNKQTANNSPPTQVTVPVQEDDSLMSAVENSPSLKKAPSITTIMAEHYKFSEETLLCVKTKVTALENSIHDLDDKYSQLVEDIDTLKGTNDDVSKLNSKLDSSINKFDRAINRLISTNDEKIGLLNSKINLMLQQQDEKERTFKDQLSEMSCVINKLQHENKNLQINYDTTEAEFIVVKEEIQQLHDRNKDLQAKYDMLTAEMLVGKEDLKVGSPDDFKVATHTFRKPKSINTIPSVLLENKYDLLNDVMIDEDKKCDDVKIVDGRNVDETKNKQSTQNNESADVVLIGNSLIRDIIPERLHPNRKVTKHRATYVSDASKVIDKTKSNNTSYVIIHEGSNDVVNNDVDDVVKDMKSLITKAKQAHPKASLIISSILPRGNDHSINERIHTINSQIESHCDNEDKVEFFYHHKLSNARNLYCRDGIHLNEGGASVLAANYIGKMKKGPTVINNGQRKTNYKYHSNHNSNDDYQRNKHHSNFKKTFQKHKKQRQANDNGSYEEYNVNFRNNATLPDYQYTPNQGMWQGNNYNKRSWNDANYWQQTQPQQMQYNQQYYNDQSPPWQGNHRYKNTWRQF
uniref:SWI5-dependent HO expression protein 3-like n=1 Tax=Saccoglossus kowalevskii TaxID=10224 RepID=A0ABM0N0I0_SACKO|nr:PREDICTED: SWI5-dependent HO expression protein 3-like [Saccoglossus kowalevskii]